MMIAPTANSESSRVHIGHQPIRQLGNEHKSEVLNFLSARPLHTFVMASWIADNGVVSHSIAVTSMGIVMRQGNWKVLP
jgi:hypothetical protein